MCTNPKPNVKVVPVQGMLELYMMGVLTEHLIGRICGVLEATSQVESCSDIVTTTAS